MRFRKNFSSHYYGDIVLSLAKILVSFRSSTGDKCDVLIGFASSMYIIRKIRATFSKCL